MLNLLTTEAARGVEASLPMNQSHDALAGQIRRALKVAHGQHPDGWSENSPYPVAVFPAHVVYSMSGQLHKRSYTVTHGAAGTEPTITLGKVGPAHAAYVDTKMDEAALSYLLPTPADAQESGETIVLEGITFVGDFSTAREASAPIKVPIKIIQAGWGSSAYYSKEVLKRDGPKVFTKGTHMMWNHATETEESERPEGDLSDLAAVLTKDAYWDDNGPKGAGLYSEAKVFSDYAQQVTEKGPHIGVSINAAIRTREGTVDGRTGRIAEQFLRAFSTDFVTKPGAGGAPVVPARESQRGPQQETATMTDQEKAELEGLKTANATLTRENSDLKTRLGRVEESQNQVLAIGTVAAVLQDAGISFSQKVLERACLAPVMKDGKLDQNWVKSVVADFSEGHEGRVRDFGDRSTRESDRGGQTMEVSEKRLKEALKNLGMPEKSVDFAMAR